MPSQEQLQTILNDIDGRGYKAYKDLRDTYTFPTFTLYIDHVQGDPFAAPSRLRVRVPQENAAYPTSTFANKSRHIALCTYLATAFSQAAHHTGARRGSGKSGLIEIDTPGQQIIERTCIDITADHVEARFAVGLPAAGRRILGREACALLCEDVPAIVANALSYCNNDADLIRRYVESSEDADALRQQLADKNLVAFVAADSVLPRRSGVDDRPLDDGAIPFKTPPNLQVQFDLPNAGPVVGLGIPQGVTLIVGGGFHGKSTLLNALERGVYNHIPGDGRHLVITDPTAVKIRAEDGRRVVGVDISPFIKDLPYGRATDAFCTDNASGSTSQAANILEALEVGARALLIDEDTAATNFMIRDQRMQQLIAKDNEPITPLIDRVRQLWHQHGVSTVLVVGGSGDYFDVADTVIAMENYLPRDATSQAKEIAAALQTQRRAEGGDAFGPLTPRIPLPHSLDARKGRREVNIKTRGKRTVLFGEQTIDLSAVEQLVDPSQTRALAAALYYAREKYMDGQQSLAQVLHQVMQDIERDGLDVLDNRKMGDHALFRIFELAAALNRLRTLEVQQ
jgi:predicted ABC-class ATPase